LKYLSEKDVFQIFYRSKLAKRLIYHHSLSDTAEASMIFKLKEVCPFQFTNKIQRMFNGKVPSRYRPCTNIKVDMDLSRELTETLKTHASGGVTLDVTVLGANSWPMHAPEQEFVIPREILPTYEHFTSYYHSNHSGRKLTWLWNYSTNRLRAYYLNQKYILVTTSYQMAILLQYNKSVSLSLEELIGSTGIQKELLVQILELLVRMKLLVNEEPDQYDLNFKFTSKKVCYSLYASLMPKMPRYASISTCP
jgi:cullin 1